jgi:hypothetical protein
MAGERDGACVGACLLSRHVGRSTGARCATPPDPSLPASASCLSRGCSLSQTAHSSESRVTIARHSSPVTRPWSAVRRSASAAALLALAALVGGCATGQPRPIAARELAEAETFPFFKVYWVGPAFGRYRLVAADGRADYDGSVGEGVYYGDCLPGKSSALGGSGCALPLRVSTLFYVRHANASLGAQRNTILRGVPAVAYDSGDAIELYSGRVAIDVTAADPAEALRAAGELRPLNAPGAAAGPLPPPVYCPGLTPRRPAPVRSALLALPGRPCQKAAATLRIDRALFGKG